MKRYLLLVILLFANKSIAQNFQDTKGELQISNSGSATYTLPIAIPPSIKNVAPIINLTYNSGVRGGIAGQGWSINGISFISRIATRRDIDGFLDGVDFDDNDKLALDGQRLLLKTGTYWADGSTYETEFKSNTKIELKIEGGITYFIVTSPDGSRSWYGSKGSGSLQNSVSVNAWYIVYFEDVYGNGIDYNYSTVVYGGTNQLYIDTITFSGNVAAGIASQDKIKFIYENSARVERDFMKGDPVYATQILKNIEVYANNSIFRTYKLTHETDSFLGYQRVSSIQEINAQNEPSNPVVFEYNTTATTTTRTETIYNNYLDFTQARLAGDFDGDGRLDFVANSQIFTNLFNGLFSNLPIYIPSSNPNLLFSATLLKGNKINQFQSIINPVGGNNYINLINCEIQGLSVVNSVLKTISFDNTIRIDEGYKDEDENYVPSIAPPVETRNNEYFEGDFNGDGISEVLILSKNESYVWTQYINGSGYPEGYYWKYTEGLGVLEGRLVDLNPNSPTEEGSKGNVLLSEAYQLSSGKKFVMDMNGDGKADILVISPFGDYSVYEIRQLNAAPWAEIVKIGFGILDEYSLTKQMLFGDYNGDGKTDIMLPDTEGGEGHVLWHTYYSNPNPAGGSFFVKESYLIVEYRPVDGGQQSTYYAMDINGDGKSDMVRVWRNYYKPNWTINDHNTEWSVTAYTNNIGRVGATNAYSATYFAGNFSSDSPDIPIPLTSNYRYQGANTDLIIVRAHNYKVEYYQFNKNVDTDNRLKSVTEANGNIKQSIEYLPMVALNNGLGNPATDFYSSTNSVNYPDVELIKNPESYLVSKLTATINGVSKYQDFKYHGHVSNFNYGTVGFKRTSRSSWYLASSTDPKIWSTENNDVKLRGATTITWASTNPQTVFAAVPDNLLTTKTNYFTTYTQGSSMSSSNGQNNIVITAPVTTDQTYIADNSITASSLVSDGVTVNYKAPSISLKPGFSVKTSGNNQFRAVPVAAGSSATTPKNYVYHVLLDKQTVKDHLTGVNSETTFTYDGTVNSDTYYGMQMQSVTKQYSGTTLQGTTTINNTYDHNPNGTGAAYYIGRPKSVNTTKTIYTGDTRTSSETYTYSGNNLTKIEKKGHNTYAIIEDMTYDSVGNLLTKTVSAPGAPIAITPRMILDEYDATKRFVVRKMDHQLFNTYFVYNTLGQVTQSTNYLGVVSDYTYDNWGKLTKSKTTGIYTTPLETTITYAKLSDGGYTVTSQNTVGDQAKSITQYDVLGKVVISTTKGLALNSTISKKVVYDGLGRKLQESEPYFSAPAKWTIYEYDYLQRPKKITASTTRVQTIDYSAGLTTTINDNGKITKATIDALGNKVQTIDDGGTIDFTYYANGQLKESNYDGHKVSITIDGWGNKIAMNDPNAGNYTYAYDAFGQITNETTPKGSTIIDYDTYGRLLKKKIQGDGADYIIDYAYNSFSQLISETSTKTSGASIDTFTYTYDSKHRPDTIKESNGSFEQTKTLGYDTYGRVISETNFTNELGTGLTSSVITKSVYNAYNGILDKITDENNNPLWQLNTANEKMQALTATLGNGVGITNVYNTDGYFTSQRHIKNSVDILYNTYNFDSVKGILNNRQNVVLGTNETFGYDALDRLLNWTNPLTSTQDSNGYDNKGRITTHNKLGTVNYNTNTATGIYRKKSIDLTTAGLNYYTSLPKQDVVYTMFKSPMSINEKDSSKITDKGGMNFVYNSHLSRQTMNYGFQVSTGTYTKTKHYTDDGTVEIIKTPTTVTIRTYIGGDAYTAPLYVDKVKTISGGAITEKKYYLHRDYLGSIIAISDDAGVAVERRQFDAWGNLAKLQQNGVAITLPTDGTAAGLMMMDRGYTGHEHLAEVGLIQMNGRLYDPQLRTFLMPDNFIQQPENTQSYNRYAYVLNNPLKYIDPSGEYWLEGVAAAVVIGVAIAAATYTLTALLTDVPFTLNGLAKTTFIAAASAAVTYGIGSACSQIGNFFIRSGVQALAHGTFQGAMTSMSGGKFWSGFAAGALSSIAASVWSGGSSYGESGVEIYNSGMTGIGSGLGDAGMIAFGTVAGGAGAALTGGNFWQGAVTGLFVSGLNHAMHGGLAKKDSEVDILEDTEGAGGKGHMAVGGGNDKQGWKYVSKYADTNDPDGGLVSGGKSSAVLNEYNTRSEMLRANPEYDKVIRLKCTYRTAMRVINGTYKAALEDYHFMMSNCAQAVGAGLNAAGIFSGSSMVPKTRYLEIAKHYYPWSNPSSGSGGSW